MSDQRAGAKRPTRYAAPSFLLAVAVALAGVVWLRAEVARALRNDRLRLEHGAAAAGLSLRGSWHEPDALWPRVVTPSLTLRLGDATLVRTGAATLHRAAAPGSSPVLSLDGPLVLALAPLVGPSPAIRIWADRLDLRFGRGRTSVLATAPQLAPVDDGPDRTLSGRSARADIACDNGTRTLDLVVDGTHPAAVDGTGGAPVPVNTGAGAVAVPPDTLIVRIRAANRADGAWRATVRWPGADATLALVPFDDGTGASLRLDGHWRALVRAAAAMEILTAAEADTAIGLADYLGSNGSTGAFAIPVRLDDTGALRVGALRVAGPGALTAARLSAAARLVENAPCSRGA